MTTIHVTTHSRLVARAGARGRLRLLGSASGDLPRRLHPALGGPRPRPDLRRCDRGHTGGRRHQLGAMPVRLVTARLSQGSSSPIPTSTNPRTAAGSSEPHRPRNGSNVDMIWIREFTDNARGKVFGTLFRLVGKIIFTREAKRTIRNAPPRVDVRSSRCAPLSVSSRETSARCSRSDARIPLSRAVAPWLSPGSFGVTSGGAWSAAASGHDLGGSCVAKGGAYGARVPSLAED